MTGKSPAEATSSNGWRSATNSAQHILFIISPAYLAAPYSSWERRAAMWVAATDKPRFALPVVVEECEVPTMLRPRKRCDLYGIEEEEARRRFADFLAPPSAPTAPSPFPRTTSRKAGVTDSSNSLAAPTTFPGHVASPQPITTGPKPSEGPHIVLLIHGIRDYGLWQTEIKDELHRSGFVAVSTNYGRFHLVRFLIPVSFFRNQAIAEIERQVRDVRKEYPNSPISVIAHSFGTYVSAYSARAQFRHGLRARDLLRERPVL